MSKTANRIGYIVAALLFLVGPSSAQRRDRFDRSDLDLLIRNVTVVDVINKQTLPKQTIGIRKGQIVLIADTSRILRSKAVIDGSEYIALPGFINTHTHLWQHVCKACYPKEKLQEWVRVYRAIHYLEADELYNVVLAASSEALLSGITTVSDYASLSFNDYGFEANARAARDAGLGGILVWHNPSVFLPDRLKLVEIQRLRDAYTNHFDIWMGFGGLSFYSLPQVYSGIRIAQKLDMHMSEHTMENVQEQRALHKSLTGYYETHKAQLKSDDRLMLEQAIRMEPPASTDSLEQVRRNSEQVLAIDESRHRLTADEINDLQRVKQKRTISPLPILDYLKALPNYLAIHSVWQQKEDIQIMRRNNVAVSHNPESNMYLSSGIAPVHDYLNSGLLVSLGTDGAASNDGINFFSAMREMWNVYKIDLMDTEVSKNLDEWKILQAATINGAKALMIDGKTGSLTIGKEADIILISKNELGVSPFRLANIVPLLIYSANARNVKYVISDGKIVVRNGNLVRHREKDLASSLSRIARAVDDRIKSGKTWREDNHITEKSAYWYKFRSVREPDTIDLSIRNVTRFPLNVAIISSAVPFGGDICRVIDNEVRERFPETCHEESFEHLIILMPGQRVQIIRMSDQKSYQIVTPSKIFPAKFKNGQLLVLAERRS